jgi:hypothetical protein
MKHKVKYHIKTFDIHTIESLLYDNCFMFLSSTHLLLPLQCLGVNLSVVPPIPDSTPSYSITLYNILIHLNVYFHIKEFKTQQMISYKLVLLELVWDVCEGEREMSLELEDPLVK